MFQIGNKRCAVLLPKGKALLCRSAVNGALDVEDRVDTADRFHCQRRDGGLFAALLELRGNIGQLEEIAARMAPAQGAGQRRRQAVAMEQGIIAGIGISLKNASPTAQMAHRMLAPPVAGIMEDRCGRCRSAKRSIIPNIGPDPARIGLGLGQHWHCRIIAMQPLCGQDMRLDQQIERRQRSGAGADLIGQGRKAQFHALAGVAVTLAVERLMRAELLEQQHRQEAGAK